MSTKRGDRTASEDSNGERGKKPRNIAPDAVKDPNEKTDGKPGLPQGRNPRDDDVDPGGG